MAVYELYAGVVGRKRLEQIEKLVTLITVFGLGVTQAAIAGRIYTSLKAKGRLIENQDIIIAGICIANNPSLFTKNISHFSIVPQLNLYPIA